MTARTNPSPPKGVRSRILVINANWLGDALFSTPALRALRKKYPRSHIACLAPPRVLDALKSNPHLDEVLTYDDRSSLLSLGEFARVVRGLKKRSFDTAIFFHRSKTKVFFVKMAGIPERIGYSAPGRDILLTQAVKPPLQAAHRIDFFLNLLEAFGVASDGRHMEFFPEASAEKSLSLLLSEHGLRPGERYAVAHAGGNWELKRWPVGHFAASIRQLSDEFKLKFVLCGSASEENIAHEITSRLAESQALSLCGKTSLDMLAILLKNAAFLLSNDSGPIHLAATQKTRILGLFGPTSAALTGPSSEGPMKILSKDVGCALPCYYRSCNYRVCMDWLLPEEVLHEARELMKVPV